MKPLCSIGDGDWPKTRVVVSHDGKKKSFIYKSKVQKDSNLVEEFSSNYALVHHILDVKRYQPDEKGINQEFFATTTTLRHIFKHNIDDNIELHICVLKLGQEMYYNFGKLITTGTGENKEIIVKRFQELSSSETVNIVPANSPVIQKLLHENSPLLESIESNELYKINLRYSSSYSNHLVSYPLIKSNEVSDLLDTFKYMDYE